MSKATDSRMENILRDEKHESQATLNTGVVHATTSLSNLCKAAPVSISEAEWCAALATEHQSGEHSVNFFSGIIMKPQAESE